MNKLVESKNKELRITSVELVKIINEFRKIESETIEKSYKELQHKDFMKKIRTELDMLKTLGLGGERNISPSSYVNIQNKTQPCYSLNRDGMLQMLNSESALVRYKTIEYINSLEEKLSIVDPKAELLLSIYNGGQEGIAASKKLTEIEVAEATKPLNNKIEKMTPAVETLGTLVNKDDCWSVEMFSKVLNIPGMGRNNMFKWMRSKGILKFNNIPYQSYAKYFNVVPRHIGKVGITTHTTLINYDGIIYLHKRLAKDNYISIRSIDDILEELNNNVYEIIKEDNSVITPEEYDELVRL